jgi:hypothetical protein
MYAIQILRHTHTRTHLSRHRGYKAKIVHYEVHDTLERKNDRPKKGRKNTQNVVSQHSRHSETHTHVSLQSEDRTMMLLCGCSFSLFRWRGVSGERCVCELFRQFGVPTLVTVSTSIGRNCTQFYVIYILNRNFFVNKANDLHFA